MAGAFLIRRRTHRVDWMLEFCKEILPLAPHYLPPAAPAKPWSRTGPSSGHMHHLTLYTLACLQQAGWAGPQAAPSAWRHEVWWEQGAAFLQVEGSSGDKAKQPSSSPCFRWSWGSVCVCITVSQARAAAEAAGALQPCAAPSVLPHAQERWTGSQAPTCPGWSTLYKSTSRFWAPKQRCQINLCAY